MDVRYPRLWKVAQVTGSIVWGVFVVSMFLSIGAAVIHGWNPSGFPDFTP